jgi:cytochrome d ubiquinol oxidase subunit II
MLSAVSPIWDGNETWLVVTGVILWGAFPIAYATLLSAFYLPLLIMRPVAIFERHAAKNQPGQPLVEGLPITNGQYTGGDFGWFSPFAALCGLGLCLGYALLGACWLVKKCEGDVRTTAYRLIPYLAVGLLIFLIVVFIYSLAENLQVMGRWIERPYLFVFRSPPHWQRSCSRPVLDTVETICPFPWSH